jgi:ABC-2 type transport system ATP-binding protein
MSLNVKADNLSKSYGDVLAVDNITITVSSGSIVGFLGPNGAGKTTTLKMLTGLLKPDKGIVNICGHNIQTDSISAKSKLGYVPDIPHLYEKLTPVEFLNFIADVFKIDKKIAQNRITDLVELFDLGEHLKKLNSSLSHGNKQKVSLAAAILHRPDVLLLDEPTGGLDPRVTRKIKDIILQLARDGCAVLLSTHILEIAENMCDYIYIINKGRIVANGDIETLKDSAKSESSLEELFIELTGGSEYNEVIKYLRN